MKHFNVAVAFIAAVNAGVALTQGNMSAFFGWGAATFASLNVAIQLHRIEQLKK